LLVVYFLFLFQAEDGIRDSSVTGVQTCALPICVGGEHRGALVLGEQDLGDDVGPVEAVAEARRREEVGLARLAAVDLPADQLLAAGRGVVVARGRPEDPALLVAVREEGEQLLAV